MKTHADPKTNAARLAVSSIQEGMVVGLGTGSTAKIAIDLIGEKVKDGLKIVGIPTSQRSADQAKGLSIPLTTLEDVTAIDLTIDGADRVKNRTHDLIKGLGGALLREKLVAVSSKRLIIVVDDSKLRDQFGDDCPVPVEVVPFAWQRTVDRIARLGARPVPRLDEKGKLYVTDGGNYIMDCHFEAIENPTNLHNELKALAGVVETGLFIAMNPRVIVGTKDEAYEL